MKKSYLLVLMMLVTSLCLFFACKPEPEPEPDNNNVPIDNNTRKIKRIYRSDGMYEEKWSWNNDKLHTIDYYSQGTLKAIETYSYNTNGQLTRVDINGVWGNYYYECEYKDNKISKISDYNYDGTCSGLCMIKYDGTKISEVIAESYYDKKIKNHPKEEYITPIRMLLPQKLYSLNNTKRNSGVEISVIKFKWNGENISTILGSYEYNDDDYYEEYTEITEYKYDNKRNPFYNHLSALKGATSYFLDNSINNIKYSYSIETESYSYDGIVWETDTYEYTNMYEYTYDGEYPISYRNSDYSTTTYYEYESDGV